MKPSLVKVIAIDRAIENMNITILKKIKTNNTSKNIPTNFAENILSSF